MNLTCVAYPQVCFSMVSFQRLNIYFLLKNTVQYKT